MRDRHTQCGAHISGIFYEWQKSHGGDRSDWTWPANIYLLITYGLDDILTNNAHLSLKCATVPLILKIEVTQHIISLCVFSLKMLLMPQQ